MTAVPPLAYGKRRHGIEADLLCVLLGVLLLRAAEVGLLELEFLADQLAIRLALVLGEDAEDLFLGFLAGVVDFLEGGLEVAAAFSALAAAFGHQILDLLVGIIDQADDARLLFGGDFQFLLDGR